jgi:hypothetical protein
MTQLSRPAKEPPAARPGDPFVSRYLFTALGAGILSGLAATVMMSFHGPTSQLSGTVGEGEPPASISLYVPNGADPRELRVTLLESGSPAQSESGKAVRDLDPSALSAVRVKPGNYVARVTYRGKLAADLTLEAAPGARKMLPLSGRKLAALEYAAGEAADRFREGDGIPYFRRTVQLDAKQVPARLQLAAYELVHGAPNAVRAQLNAVRRLDPANKDAAAVEKLLQMRLTHRR